MKILEQFLTTKKTKLNRTQILRWLCWIKSTCWFYSDCQDCPFKGYPDLDGMLCRVRNIYKEIYPNRGTPKFPNEWRNLYLDGPRVEPKDLNFLREIKWSDSGNPIPELKEGVE